MSAHEIPRLSDLLALDKADSNSAAPTPVALVHVFGDSHLIRRNRIFRKIREAAKGFGYSFSNDRSERYEALPFTCLEDLLAERKIPIVHNRKAVEIVALKVPEANWLDIADGFRRCFAFHESCHAVARETLKGSFGAGPATPPTRVLYAMLEESFANTCELFGIMDCETDADLALYEANSYTALWETRDLLNEIGLDPVAFLYVMLHYLRANFLRSPGFSETEHLRILKLSETTLGRTYPRESEELASLASVAYTLDENFRQTTSLLHLKLRGLPTNLDSRDPIAELETRSEHPSLILDLKKLSLIFE